MKPCVVCRSLDRTRWRGIGGIPCGSCLPYRKPAAEIHRVNELIGLSSCIWTTKGRETLDKDRTREFLDQAAQLAEQGLRVIAFAQRSWTQAAEVPHDDALEQDLQLMGLVELQDPLRPEVPAALQKCKAAGIRVIMITGDHPLTARALAQQAYAKTAEATPRKTPRSFSLLRSYLWLGLWESAAAMAAFFFILKVVAGAVQKDPVQPEQSSNLNLFSSGKWAPVVAKT